MRDFGVSRLSPMIEHGESCLSGLLKFESLSALLSNAAAVCTTGTIIAGMAVGLP
jgi:hypothetical protein